MDMKVDFLEKVAHEKLFIDDNAEISATEPRWCSG